MEARDKKIAYGQMACGNGGAFERESNGHDGASIESAVHRKAGLKGLVSRLFFKLVLEASTIGEASSKQLTSSGGRRPPDKRMRLLI